MKLATYEFGEDQNQPPLLIVHGLFGSARNWRAIAKRLSTTRRVITVDMRNHGDSPWDSDHSYTAMAEDLIEVITSIEQPVDLLGHSMGGKAAMITTLKRPELINRLLVADIAPVTYTHDQASNVAIMKSLPLDGLSSRSEADKLMAKQLDDLATRAFFLQSLDFSNRPPRWVLNLDALEKDMRLITGFPETNGQVQTATVFLDGIKSNYITEDNWKNCSALFPNAQRVRIDAGHWLHAEAPAAFIAAVEEFLSQS